MSLLVQLKEDFKVAMKARDVAKKGVLSFVISQIMAKVKDGGADLSDTDMMQVIKKEIKTRKESVAMYAGAGKAEDAADEQKKIDVLLTYLPVMMSRDEMVVLITKLIADLGITDVNKQKGQLIGAIMKDHRAVIDGGLMNELIGEMAAQKE